MKTKEQIRQEAMDLTPLELIAKLKAIIVKHTHMAVDETNKMERFQNTLHETNAYLMSRGYDSHMTEQSVIALDKAMSTALDDIQACLDSYVECQMLIRKVETSDLFKQKGLILEHHGQKLLRLYVAYSMGDQLADAPDPAFEDRKVHTQETEQVRLDALYAIYFRKNNPFFTPTQQEFEEFRATLSKDDLAYCEKRFNDYMQTPPQNEEEQYQEFKHNMLGEMNPSDYAMYIQTLDSATHTAFFKRAMLELNTQGETK